ncbi:MAG: bifunctional 4-hydroxy-2-oxoglutarate aldolase/2-dehydro-3-deoxy-phosphogluconate aldolase [Candidatus Omnitrophica bacterium]|nr:bifunctional 4-hydroxy-2-oxoglutarate aldolase/2-dehydro-3-deoxy-phosphogluconate aldolase [Candidatus Omnitrophota bacterium]
MDIGEFKKQPLLGILRGIELSMAEPLVSAIIDSGLKTIEIAMNTRGAADIIRKVVKLSRKRLVVGAGTVLDMASLKSALSAGASFMVMPVLVKDVTAYCVKNKIPCFPGALTPQEIYAAWQAGAAMVKVFPCGMFGPAYFKEIKGPFNDIELLACGGVTAKNLREYIVNGASAASFGSSVFRNEWLAAGDYARISESIRQFVRQF